MAGMSGTIVKIYDYSGNYIREISLEGSYDRIYSDGETLFISNSSEVVIYTVAGDYVGTINESIIMAVAVKSNKIYIAVRNEFYTEFKVKVYLMSGVFQLEFPINSTVSDVVII